MRGQVLTFSIAAALAAVFAGCEWTSSSGDATWSGNFGEAGDLVDQMDFSGTYRNASRGGCAIITKAESSTSSDTVVSEGYYDEFSGYSASRTSYADQLKYPPRDQVAVMYTPDYTYYAEGNQFVCSAGSSGGSGSLNSQGGWTLHVPSPVNSGTIRIFYTPDTESSTGAGSSSTSIEAITVSQSGASLVFRASNGVTMNGTITMVNVYSNDTSITFNAQFNASGSDNSFVGTLDDRSGYKKLNGTWTSGSTIYDVSGTTEDSTSN